MISKPYYWLYNIRISPVLVLVLDIRFITLQLLPGCPGNIIYIYMYIHSGIALKVICVHFVFVIHSEVTVLVTRCCNCSCYGRWYSTHVHVHTYVHMYGHTCLHCVVRTRAQFDIRYNPTCTHYVLYVCHTVLYVLVTLYCMYLSHCTVCTCVCHTVLYVLMYVTLYCMYLFHTVAHIPPNYFVYFPCHRWAQCLILFQLIPRCFW